MLLSELQERLETDLTYPIDSTAVIDRIGDAQIDAPDTDDSETIASILEPLGPESFESPDELFTTIFGNVSDEFIGRKFYDDRGGDPLGTYDGTGDERDVSF